MIAYILVGVLALGVACLITALWAAQRENRRLQDGELEIGADSEVVPRRSRFATPLVPEQWKHTSRPESGDGRARDTGSDESAP